jgi:hypothetical protein
MVVGHTPGLGVWRYEGEAPGCWGELQQPVQQRDSNGAVPDGTAVDVAAS